MENIKRGIELTTKNMEMNIKEVEEYDINKIFFDLRNRKTFRINQDCKEKLFFNSSEVIDVINKRQRLNLKCWTSKGTVLTFSKDETKPVRSLIMKRTI